MIPSINLRRTYLIARRDFLGYIKTWGFWLSFLMPFVIFTIAFGAGQMDINVDPVRYETILDETGEYGEKIKAFDLNERKKGPIKKLVEQLKDAGVEAQQIKTLEKTIEEQGVESLASMLPPGTDMVLDTQDDRNVYVKPPASNLSELKTYLRGEKLIEIGGASQKLGSLLHIYENDGQLKVDYWSENISNTRLKSVTSKYFKEKAETQYLGSAGLTMDGLSEARSSAISVKAFDPSKTGVDENQAVTMNDRIPMLVSAVAAGLLWLTIFSGAYMLLTSMLEEKLNKLLEMMLSTTRLSEIMIGKLIGVAALTLTAMLPYFALMIVGTFFMSMFGPPEVTLAILQAITPKLIIFFIVFLILGYVFYGSLFIAMGSLANSMQDAQTITTPIMLILTACIMVVPLSMNSPDSPLLTFASWFPLSAPFAAIARLPQDPPWWELALSAFFLFLLSMLVIWLAGRIFKYGVLSGAGVKGVSAWFKRVILRRKSA